MYGVARNEQASIVCDLDADPSEISFSWRLNSSSSGAVDLKAFTVVNGTRSVASFVPKTRHQYGTLTCAGTNAIGRQVEPCIFNVVPAGPPEAVRSCHVANQSLSSLSVICTPGDSGGLRSIYILEVYNSANGHLLHTNITTTDAPHFQVSNLPAGTKFALSIYAYNPKGRSPVVNLAASTLYAPEPHTRGSGAAISTDQLIYNPLLGILILVTSGFVLVGLVAIAVMKFRAKMRASRQRRGATNGANHQSSLSGDNQSDSAQQLKGEPA